MNVGLYFGTFDPLHNGHLAIVGHLLTLPQFDAVWLVPSPQSPHKTQRTIPPFAQRCRAIELVLQALSDSRLSLCTVEGDMPQPSYTILTLSRLRQQYPHCQFALVIGSDNAQHLPQWCEGETILAQYPVYIYPRRGSLVSDALLRTYPNMQLLQAPLVEISSTAIRQGRAAGHNMDYFLPLLHSQRVGS